MPDDVDLNDARLKLASAFSPRGPIDNRDLFAGRSEQLFQLVEVLHAQDEHVVIYGERGVGKTSIAAVAAVYAQVQGHLCIRVNCDSQDDFASICVKVGQTLEIEKDSYVRIVEDSNPSIVPSEKKVNLDEDLEEAAHTLTLGQNAPGDVLLALRRIAHTKPMVVIDEFDVLRGQVNVTQQLADLIKGLSDHLIPATLMVVGVADSVHELLGSHESIGRSLRQIEMPRMSPDELGAIVDKGLATSGMTIEPDAKNWIVSLSQGLPHYTHLLAQQSGLYACESGEMRIRQRHVEQAIEGAVANAQEGIRQAYLQAVTSPQESNLFPTVLLAAALADTDERGYFRPADLLYPMQRLLGERVHQSKYNGHLPRLADNRGRVLERIGTARKWRYRFREPLMKPYVLMRGLQDGLIDPEDLGPANEG